MSGQSGHLSVRSLYTGQDAMDALEGDYLRSQSTQPGLPDPEQQQAHARLDAAILDEAAARIGRSALVVARQQGYRGTAHGLASWMADVLPRPTSAEMTRLHARLANSWRNLANTIGDALHRRRVNYRDFESESKSVEEAVQAIARQLHVETAAKGRAA